MEGGRKADFKGMYWDEEGKDNAADYNTSE